MIKWKNTACVDGGIHVFEDRAKFESRKRNKEAESRIS
jgi:hypothetical protein